MARAAAVVPDHRGRLTGGAAVGESWTANQPATTDAPCIPLVTLGIGTSPPPIEEDSVLSLIGIIIIGLVAGYVARAVVPGRDPMGIGGTLLLGVVGSFVGGFLFNLLFSRGEGLLATSGLIGSIIGAIIALLLYRQLNERSGRRA